MITRDRLTELMHSLEQLAGLPEWPRVILVDNNSSDGTKTRVADRFPDVEVVPLSENLGAAGRNVGVERAPTPYVAFCDDDTWWEPGALDLAVRIFDEHPRLGIITGRILIGTDAREDPICSVFERTPLPSESGLPGFPLLGFMAGASVVRRSAFLEAGGFEARYLVGGEEEILAIDLVSMGWSIRYVPEIVVHHHPSTRRDGASRRRTQVRNALWSAWLRRPLGSAVRRTLTLMRDARTDGEERRGLGMALAGLPWVLKGRRTVPSHVESGLRLLDEDRGTSKPEYRPSPAASAGPSPTGGIAAG